jgi:hypothetical protein
MLKEFTFYSYRSNKILFYIKLKFSLKNFFKNDSTDAHAINIVHTYSFMLNTFYVEQKHMWYYSYGVNSLLARDLLPWI